MSLWKKMLAAVGLEEKEVLLVEIDRAGPRIQRLKQKTGVYKEHELIARSLAVYDCCLDLVIGGAELIARYPDGTERKVVIE